MKHWLIGLLILICFLVVFTFVYEEISGGFSQSKISHEFSHEPEWKLPQTTPEQRAWLQTVLKQPYKWLGQGHQVFAFISADQKYVLKIFKFKRLNPSSTAQYLSELPFLKEYYAQLEKKRKSRINKLFEGYKVAYLKDQENTGILFLHYDNEKDLNMRVKVEDKIGMSHDVDLDAAVFAIQESAVKTKDVLSALLAEGNVKAAKERIGSLFDLYLREYKLGLMDQDRNILQNTGFVGEKPIRIDVGQLKDVGHLDPAVFQEDLQKIATKRLDEWLKKNYPQYEPEISTFMQRKLEHLFATG